VVSVAERLGDERVVCVLDQNIDNYDEGAFIGTDLVRELRRHGFAGLVIIHSANDELADEQEYLAAGADGCIGKAVKGGIEAVLKVIGRLWHAKFDARAGAVGGLVGQLQLQVVE